MRSDAEPRILIVDDEIRLAEVLSLALEGHGFATVLAGSVDEALRQIEAERIDLVMTDLRMPARDGRELLGVLRRERPELPVVVMTAYASLRDAVDLVKEGAFDYVEKPFEISDVVATIERALRISSVMAENRRLRDEISARYRFDQLIGQSAPFQTMLGQITDVCASRATVLVLGESGTGKELIARAIHFNSPRKARPFVAVNCAAIPEGLLESELFGHVKGAFTGATANREGRFAQADGGTLLLDEIADMPVALQAKVLRVLQEHSFEPVGSNKSVKVDVRIIAATHKDLKQMVQAGTFREDLYYRLNVFPIFVPSLRERGEDVEILARHLLAQHAAEQGKRIEGFSPPALQAMRAYRWPGNVRELQNCVERAVLVARGRSIEPQDLPDYVFDARSGGLDAAIPGDLDEALAELERGFILRALKASDGVQVRAAKMLGIEQRSLWHRIKKLGIKVGRSVETSE